MTLNLIKKWLLAFLVLNAATNLAFLPQIKCQISANESNTSLTFGDSLIQIIHYSFPVAKLDNYIRAMHLDDNGLLWVATRHQIFSFDGREANNIITPESIRLSDINEMALDTEGNIWLWRFFQDRINPILHLSVYEENTGEFRSASEAFSSHPNLDGLNFSQIAVLKNSEIMLNTTDGQIFLMTGPKNLRKIDLSNPARYLGQTNEGFIIISQQSNDQKILKLIDLEGQTVSTSTGISPVSDFAQCLENSDYLNCLELRGDTLELWNFRMKEEHLNLTSNYTAPGNTEYHFFYSGLIKEEDNQINLYRIKGDSIVKDDNVSTVNHQYLKDFIPREVIEIGNHYWIASPSGIVFATVHSLDFRTSREIDETPGTSFRKIDYVNDSVILGASYRGLLKLLFEDNQKIRLLEIPHEKRDCSGRFIHTFLESPTHDGVTYFSMNNWQKFDSRNQSCHTSDIHDFGSSEVWDIAHLWDSYMYLATNKGLFLFDEALDSFSFVDIATGQIGPFEATINRIKYDKQSQQLFLCTQSGLVMADLKTGDPHIPILNALILPRRNVNDVLLLQDGSMMVSTWDDGIFWLSQLDNKTLRHFNQNYLLASNSTHNLTTDSLGRVWFSANKGLYLMDPEKEVIRKFTTINGLKENEFNHLAQSNPRLWKYPMVYGGINGITYFDPHKFLVYEKTTSTQLIGIIAFDASGKVRAVLTKHSGGDKNTSTYKIPGRSSEFSLSFQTGLLKRQIEIYYREQNSDNPWNKTIGGKIPVDQLGKGVHHLEILLKYPDNSLSLLNEPVVIQIGGWRPELKELLLGLLGLGFILWALRSIKQYNNSTNYPEAKASNTPIITKPEERPEERRHFEDFMEEMAEREQFDSNLPPEEAEFRESIERAVENFTDFSNITIDDLASSVNLSNRHFHRKIKLAYNITPNQFFIVKKMATARKKLHGNPSMTISEVSYFIGYEKSSYFSKLFRDQYGISPREYREKYFNLLGENREGLKKTDNLNGPHGNNN